MLKAFDGWRPGWVNDGTDPAGYYQAVAEYAKSGPIIDPTIEVKPYRPEWNWFLDGGYGNGVLLPLKESYEENLPA